MAQTLIPSSPRESYPSPSHNEIRARIDGCAGVIFDNDGTLVNTMPAHYIAYSKALSEFGMAFPLKQFYEWAGMPAGEIIDRLRAEQQKGHVVTERVLELRKGHLKEALMESKPIAPVVELLEYAKQVGKPVAIASGGEREDVEASLKAAGIDMRLFDAVVTREDVTRGKPDPESFSEAAKRMGVYVGGCVGFEDGELGMEGMERAGMWVVDVRGMVGYPKAADAV
eukprot:GFKZ01007541.1.p1 GENE.GFKZ01007541.1~~GFKZ01007541.1.p1  ORF type:complete len:226 (+),score=42.17 GFKZ01007541.1:342-1019(+)